MLRYFIFTLFLFLSVPVLEAKDFEQFKDEVALPILPQCNDTKLMSLLNDKISEYYQKRPSISQLEKRTQKLMEKHLKYFENVDVSSITPKDNVNVINRLMSVKINNGLDNHELRLCKTSANSNLPEVYLLIYTENYYYIVDIINFYGISANKEFFVIYD